MAEVRISDVVIPEVFAPYFNQRFTEKDLLVQRGIVSRNGSLRTFIDTESEFSQHPFWNTIDPDSPEDIGTDDPASFSTPDKITADFEVAARSNRNKSWSHMLLVKYLTGSNPMDAIASGLVKYWLHRRQIHMLAILEGLFLDNVASDSGDMVNDVYLAVADATSKLQRSVLIGATHTSGDHFDEYTDIFMHSDTHETLSNDDQIDFIKPSDNSPVIGIYEGLQVHIDDDMPKELSGNATKYTSYLFGPGSFSGEEGTMDPGEAFEIDRIPSAGDGSGQDTLHNRLMYVLHPNGFQYTIGSGANPSNTILETAGAWTRVIERKLVRMAAVIHTQ